MPLSNRSNTVRNPAPPFLSTEMCISPVNLTFHRFQATAVAHSSFVAAVYRLLRTRHWFHYHWMCAAVGILICEWLDFLPVTSYVSMASAVGASHPMSALCLSGHSVSLTGLQIVRHHIVLLERTRRSDGPNIPYPCIAPLSSLQVCVLFL